MQQLARRLGLALEALADVTLERELGRQHLDRHPALQLLVPGAIDHAHAPAADFTLEGVMVGERLGDALGQRLVERVGHPVV